MKACFSLSLLSAFALLSLVVASDTRAQAPGSICLTDSLSVPLETDYSYASEGVIEVPIVFHVLYDDMGTGNLPDSTLALAIDSLNLAFADAGVSFHIAGINRLKNTLWFSDLRGYHSAISSALRADPRRVMNLYTGDIPGGVGGFAYYPNLNPAYFDGVYVDYAAFPGMHPWQTDPLDNDGYVIVHEVGHWSGLRHTHEEGCHDPDPPNCLTQGDRVCDTPPELQNTFPPVGSCPFRDTCLDDPPYGGPDPIYNYMAYVGGYCGREFTPGQDQKMRADLGRYRSFLGEPVQYHRDLVAGASETWEWFGTHLRFGPGYGVVVHGAMTAAGTTFGPTDALQGWAGVEVTSGGSFTAGILRLADTEVRVDGSFYVRDTGSLTLERTTLRFGPAGRFTAHGSVQAYNATFTERYAGQGWQGIRLYAPPSGGGALPSPLATFYNTMIERAGPGGTERPVYAAVEVYDRALLLETASRIQQSTGHLGGLYVSGAGASALVRSSSWIRLNAGFGVVAAAGATVVLDGLARVEDNGGVGVTAVDYGTEVELNNARVEQNLGRGVRAALQGTVHFREYVPGALRNHVNRNNGGLVALGGSLLVAGTCPNTSGPCPGSPEQHVIDNWLPGPPTGDFDARSQNGSALYAQNVKWREGVYELSDLVLDKDGSSVLVVCPLGGNAIPCWTEGRQMAGAEARGMEDVLALVDAAERARLDGDLEAFDIAATAAVVTIDTSAVEDDRRAAFEVTSRLFAWAQPAGPLAALEGLAAQPGEGQPWARRALGVAYASSEHYAEAASVAGALASSHPGSEHALFGLALAVRVAVEEEDEAGALTALAALVAAFPEAEETASMWALVLGAFPEAVLPGGRLAGPGAAPVAASAALSGASWLEVEAVQPNPASAQAVLPFRLDAEAEVEAALYDVLGRRVAVVASGRYGAGRQALSLSVASLPAGLYVVRVTARAAEGTAAVAARRLTLAR